MTEKNPARKITVNIDEVYEQRLQYLAKKEEVSVEAIILDALNKGLQVKERIESSGTYTPHRYTDRDWTEERLDPPVNSDLDMREN